MDFPAPRWLPGGHLQTIYPATCISKPAVAYRRERWDAPDGDFIDIDFVNGRAGQPFLVLFHGLEGSSQSHYCRALMAAVAARGWSGAVPHFRGCSGQINRAPRFYHSGDAEEVDWILRRLAVYRMAAGASKFYAAGASLGGNALLRWLGELQRQAEFVDAACAISAPLDLAGGGGAPRVKLEYPREGGHVGFATGAPPGRLDWLPRRVMRFLRGEDEGEAWQ